MGVTVIKDASDEFSAKEAKARFEAALKGAMNTPHKPLKVKKTAKKAKTKKQKSA
jgi:hypothetical protein